MTCHQESSDNTMHVSTILTASSGPENVTPSEATGPDAAAPRILSFQTTEDTIQIGYPTIFSWEVEGADTLTISGGVGEVSGASFAEAYLTQPGVYRLTASNEFASVVAAVELRLPLPEIHSFFAAGYTIKIGLPITLIWEVDNASEVILEPHHEPVTDLRRIEVLPDRSTTYELVARNASGEVRRQLTLTLPPPEVLSFEGDSVSTEGEPIELAWTVVNAYRVTIEPGIGEVEASGSLRVRPPAPFTKYQLCAEGHSGTAYASFEVVRFPIPIELGGLEVEFDQLLTMAQHSTQDSSIQVPTPEEVLQEMPMDAPEGNPSAELPADMDLAEDPRIRRVQEMDLAPEMLSMQKAHVRVEIVNALRKIKRILKRKLQS
jgi:hypothetical protein